MRDWPPIREPELVERLGLDDDAFLALLRVQMGRMEPRVLSPDALEWALGYPWERPSASYVIADGAVRLLDHMEPAERLATVESFTATRHPLLSYGGNASPEWLKVKFAHFEEPEDRTALVLRGELHDLDVGPAATLTPLGYMPATLFSSPGTAVRASVVWTTDAQATQLTWTEVPYRLARLDDAHFVMDEANVTVDEVFAYVHRVGSFCPDGEPLALAAVPARNRTAPGFTQAELLERAAKIALGADAGAEDLVRALFDDMVAVLDRFAATIWRTARPLQARWTPFPVPAA